MYQIINVMWKLGMVSGENEWTILKRTERGMVRPMRGEKLLPKKKENRRADKHVRLVGNNS